MRLVVSVFVVETAFDSFDRRRRRSRIFDSAAAETALRSAVDLIGVFRSGGRQYGRRNRGTAQDGDGGWDADGAVLERVDDAVVIGVLDVDVVNSEEDVALVQILASSAVEDLLDFLAVDGIGDGEPEAHVALRDVDNNDLGRW